MKRILSIVTAACMLIVCMALPAGCSVESTGEYPVTFGDVTIDREPQNIVVLNDDIADIISYIGYDIKMVGRSVECDQDFLSIVPAVGAAATPDVAAIAAAETDLVLADSTISAAAKQSIEEAGAKVVIVDPADTSEALRELYINLGMILGGNTTGRQKGEDGYTELFDMLGQLKTATSAVVKTAAYLYLNDNGELCTFVQGSLDYRFFNYNGCTNIFMHQEEPTVNIADLRIGSPTYLFYDDQAVLDYLNEDTYLAHIDALVNNRTYPIPKKNFERHGTTAEQTVFEMLNYIEKLSKATADEAETEAEAAPETEPEQDEPVADDAEANGYDTYVE